MVVVAVIVVVLLVLLWLVVSLSRGRGWLLKGCKSAKEQVAGLGWRGGRGCTQLLGRSSESGIVSQQTPVAAQATGRIGASGFPAAPHLPGVDAWWVQCHGRLGIGRALVDREIAWSIWECLSARRQCAPAARLLESLAADAATGSFHELIETCNLSLVNELSVSFSFSRFPTCHN